MSDVSKAAAAPTDSAQRKYHGGLYQDLIIVGGAIAIVTVAIALFLALVAVMSPSAIAILSEYTHASYYRVEAAYLLPPLTYLLLLSLLGFATFLARLRPMLGFALLSLCLTTILAVLVSDSNTDFTTEASKITIFTTTVLVLCGIASALNYLSWTDSGLGSRWRRGFWALLTFAFLFAAADEALMIHERLGELLSAVLGRSEESGVSPQDEITLFYAFAALAVVSAAGLALRASRDSRLHIVVFAAAALTYLASTVLDTADHSFHTPPLSPIDLPHMANTLEEMLEFLAACLFLFGCLVAFLDARQNAPLTRVFEDRVARWRGRWLQVAVGAGLVVFLGVAAATVFFSPPRGLEFRGTGELAVQAFTGGEGAPLHPDGMTTKGGRIYVVNDAPPLITVLDPASDRRAIVDASGAARTPESVAVGSDGTIFFTDDSANKVYVIDHAQHIKPLLGQQDGLRSPKGLVIGPGGDLYIADVGASAIYRYSKGVLSTYASALDGVAVPEEMAFDSYGNLYVTEDQRRVLKVSPDGRSSMFLHEARGFTPEAIAIRNDRIYLTDSSRRAVLEYDLNGVGRTLITLPATLGRQLEGVAVTRNGDVWVGIRPSEDIPGALLRIYRRAG